jgi:crotonobetainyl-CoA:carnitine CoA-transferase CaiB-like acyl-CoA transferase
MTAAAESAAERRPGALHGVRVVEVGGDLGEYCSLTLTGLGAEVWRVEPVEGAPSRHRAPYFGDDPHPDRALTFWAYNRGKGSVVCDLTKPADVERVAQLIAGADVLIDSTPRGELDAAGLALSTLEDRHPGLVIARITPFGDDGPWADYTSSDLVHLALGGPLMNCGYDPMPDGAYDLPPMAPQLNHSRHIAGEQLAFGIVAALLYRNRTGKGQRIDCAVHQAVSTCTETDLMAWVVQRQPYFRQTGRHAGPAVGWELTLAHTKDGRWLNIISIGARDRNVMRPFLARYGLEDWLPEAEVTADLNSRNIPGTGPSSSANVEIVQRFVRRFTYDTLPWQDMQEVGLLCSPVRRPHENYLDDHWRARGTYAQIAHDDLDTSLPYPVSKWIATDTDWRAGDAAPTLDRDGRVGQLWVDLPPTPRLTVADRSSEPPVLSVHGKPFALSGLRVFDFTWFLASAGGTRFLSALGADVVKVEWKEHPDTRGGGFPEGGRARRRNASAPLVAAAVGPMSGQFNNKNPGKRGISLNVRHPQGREIAEEFIRRSDVVAEGFSPGVFERWGFGYEHLRELNPSIIYAQQSGMGQFGTYGRFRAVGPIAASLAGLTGMGGLPEPALPTGWGYSYLDWLGAYSFTLAILSAIYHRDATGHGQWIDASQTEVGLFTSGVALLDWAANGREWQRSGNRHPFESIAPHGVYRCAGLDRWLAITCTTDTEWASLARATGHEDWLADDRFRDALARAEHADVLDELVTSWTVQQEPYSAMDLLQKAGVPAGVAQTAEDRCDHDPQLRHLKWLTEVPNPSVGTWPVAEVPFHMARTPAHAGGVLDKGAPVYGEHNYEVYAEVLGLSEAEVDRLAADGVV